MDSEFIFILVVRTATILLGFVALWSLWHVRTHHVHLWTVKLKEIWLCHFLLILAMTERNVELLYREVMPTLSLALDIFVAGLTIRAAFRDQVYVKE